MRRALGDQRFMGESRIAVSTTTCRAARAREMALFSSDLLRNLFRVTTAAWISCWRVARAAAVECSAFCRKRCRAESCGTAPAPLSILLPSSALCVGCCHQAA